MNDKELATIISGPILLSPDNFTPLSRTPWAGRMIGQRIKYETVPGADALRIGESWEFSCDPQFPSYLSESKTQLIDVIRKYPKEILGRADTQFCELLVKLLNPDQPLSLQVHPADDDPNLADSECGKPESWLVLEAEEGAGIYLGFSRSMSREALQQKLEGGDFSKEDLFFVPVNAGDYFEIKPGVPHAIGPGVLLLEPQRILEGKSGKTFRLWDWGRRYNKDGEQDQVHGKERELHVEASLPLVDPAIQVGEQFVSKLRVSAEKRQLAAGLNWSNYSANKYYETNLIEVDQNSKFQLSIEHGYGVVVVISGSATFGNQEVNCGQTCLIPSQCFPIQCHSDSVCFAVISSDALSVTI